MSEKKDFQMIDLKKYVDDRGFLFPIDDFPFIPKRCYLLHNDSLHTIRAFHGHKEEGKYLVPLKGKIKVIVTSMDKEDGNPVAEIILSEENPKGLFIPPGFYHGTINLTGENELMVFSDKHLGESKNDDFRKPWDMLGEDIWKVQFR